MSRVTCDVTSADFQTQPPLSPPPPPLSYVLSPETFALAFSNLLAAHKAFTLEVATKVLSGCRPDLTKKQVCVLNMLCVCVCVCGGG